MAYEKQTWVDGEDGGTPVTAATLDHIEDGIFTVDAALATKANASSLATKGNIFRVVADDSGAYPARPSAAPYVEWVGPVPPTAASTNDTWVDTSA